MKVSSPVGEFPFEPDQVRIHGGRVTLEGKMGAWPAHVELTPADAVTLARLAAPLLAAPALAVIGLSLARRVWSGGRGR